MVRMRSLQSDQTIAESWNEEGKSKANWPTKRPHVPGGRFAFCGATAGTMPGGVPSVMSTDPHCRGRLGGRHIPGGR